MQNGRDYYLRELRDRWAQASSQFPVLLLTGPRQVGKTTFLRHHQEANRQYVSLDDPSVRALAQDDPALFMQRYSAPVLIDEIQYAPQLLPLIKMEADRRRQAGLFWLTGSQQFQMMRGISETLAGRVAMVNLLGFSRRERYRLKLEIEPFLPTAERMNARDDAMIGPTVNPLYQDIWLGGMPALASGRIKDRELFHSSYLQTYLQRDVRDLAQVGDESAFLRFLRACAARTAQMLSLTDLARDADVAVNTAKKWLSILQASFQVHLLQPYHTNLSKRLVKTPKLYFLDTGLCAYLTAWSSAKSLEAGAMSGAIFETYVLTELLKSWWHRGRSPSLYYYRDKDQKEIDFVFVEDNTLYPVEVKKTASPSRDDVKAFSRLESLGLHVGPGALVCLREEALPLSNAVQAIPVSMI
ncbi:MAG: ATP-binding protein [Phycisphaeraceae bacterium]|nr:ATP-binding protein [Phycisphaeraceae bacterium]